MTKFTEKQLAFLENVVTISEKDGKPFILRIDADVGDVYGRVCYIEGNVTALRGNIGDLFGDVVWLEGDIECEIKGDPEAYESAGVGVEFEIEVNKLRLGD
jgi:hypothetical protein